ncbi:polyprenyl synthetase family protein [Aquibacillus sediminis]|uniref:polyprenyl synthetase family protein n=1 Tax=Aquibacillus sediminis TaxID=2574734 RepID=UPI001FE6FEB6|nr:farnesyl diphosphate synthase [Aquibacillus sediminis]
MNVQLTDYLQERQQVMMQALTKAIEQLDSPQRLKQAMLYSLEAGGKRVRPILMMASCESYGTDYREVLPVAIALEMVHTYSLIHDDLPAMDNDDYRRGKLTNHKKYDEATAILAGDGLLTYSFDIIAAATSLTDQQKVFLMSELSKVSGPKGMVAGQLLDMQAENKETNLEELEKIHTLKTGQLLRYAIVSGAYIGGASENQLTSIETFAHYIGLIFQVQDDILDVDGDPALIGKAVGSDVDNFKSTYPKLLGLDGAKQHKQLYVNEAKSALRNAGIKDSLLEELTDYLSNRNV